MGTRRPTGGRTVWPVALTAALGACAAGPSEAPGTGGPTAQAAPSSAVVETSPTATEAAELRFLPGPLPDEATIDTALGEAYESYRAHRRAWEDVARSGFADAELVEELVASADADLADGLRAGAARFAAEGRTIDQHSQVLDVAPTWVRIPVAEGHEMLVALEACVLVETLAEEIDGEALLDEAETDRSLMAVQMLRQDSDWLVWSHYDTGEHCAPS